MISGLIREGTIGLIGALIIAYPDVFSDVYRYLKRTRYTNTARPMIRLRRRALKSTTANKRTFQHFVSEIATFATCCNIIISTRPEHQEHAYLLWIFVKK